MRKIVSPLDGLQSPLGGLTSFSVLSLFAAGEVGAWYDPSDFSTMFQDSAGTTPVTAAGDPVGLVLDKSQGSYANLVTNGTFDSDVSGWTASTANVSAAQSSGRIQVTNNGAGWVYQAVTVTPNKPYTVIGNFVTKNGGGRLYVGSSIGGTQYGGATNAGVFVLSFTPTSSPVYINLGDSAGGAGVVNTYDSISLRPGTHASQSTSASRPVLQQDSGGRYYLSFDGVDDSLATGTISPGSVDKAQVFAGVRKLSDAAVQMLYELSANANTNDGVFQSLPGYSGVGSIVGAFWNVGAKGTTLISASSAANYAAPITAVQTQQVDIAGASLTGRINGSQVITSSASLGTGNFGSYPLYIGRRGGSTLPFNGNLYSLLVRFSATNLDATTISKTETWVNSKTGAY